MNIGDKAKIRNMIEVLTAIDKGYPVETKRIPDDRWSYFNYNKDIYLEDALCDYRVAPKERLLFTPFTTVPEVAALPSDIVFNRYTRDEYTIKGIKFRRATQYDGSPINIIIVSLIPTKNTDTREETTLESLCSDYVNKDGYPVGKITYRVKEAQYRCCTTLDEMDEFKDCWVLHKDTGKRYNIAKIEDFGVQPNITLREISERDVYLRVYSYTLFTKFTRIASSNGVGVIGVKV